MADQNNPGQFGNREDTEEQARRGGQVRQDGTSSGVTSGAFGEPESADPSLAGRAGAHAQPTEAKAVGGEHSHDNG
ncbi:hypothetical protein KCV87_03045 [Actinosynnema pretiosum subsp. pretiosum]|uniref:Uncharacterized protein n=2 Tax=Actinosynnema TaxID=40566 RepID=C6W9T6_ACTMD|nr:hypothetical protein [Actinosynnema mirum]ACU37303.1 hypothetical protein Amir_3405 [Actinosynnema mirum DSM 43827]AXX30776.1 hypothetical protein APASM_3411 [Actinosynnema pretiosum subsp. pretiosum]QUF05109.1 hypothetical protein KCV87_03045 [Actinosynnema pretiosum subsp. pretiosum]